MKGTPEKEVRLKIYPKSFVFQRVRTTHLPAPDHLRTQVWHWKNEGGEGGGRGGGSPHRGSPHPTPVGLWAAGFWGWELWPRPNLSEPGWAGATALRIPQTKQKQQWLWTTRTHHRSRISTCHLFPWPCWLPYLSASSACPTELPTKHTDNQSRCCWSLLFCAFTEVAAPSQVVTS